MGWGNSEDNNGGLWCDEGDGEAGWHFFLQGEERQIFAAAGLRRGSITVNKGI